MNDKNEDMNIEEMKLMLKLYSDFNFDIKCLFARIEDLIEYDKKNMNSYTDLKSCVEKYYTVLNVNNKINEIYEVIGKRKKVKIETC